MSSPATITDVAKAAGVAKSTVSCVMNGQADKYRIGHDTQMRILTIARQLDYHPNQVAREIALGHGAAPLLGISTPLSGISDEKSKISNMEPKKPWIGLIISASTSSESMNLIPSLVQVLTAAGYQLVIDAITAEPSSAHELVTQFLRDRISGIICCPTVYSAASAIVASQCPIIVLWQGAGKAIIKTVCSGQSAVGSEESSGGSGQLAVSSPTGNSATINPATQQPKPVKTEAQYQAPKTAFNVVATVSGGTGSVTAHSVSPPLVTTIPVSKPEPISHETPKPMVTPEPPPVVITSEQPVQPPQVPEPTPPVSVPVVAPPPPEDPTPTPVIAPEPGIVVEPAPPASEPEPAPTDGTEAVPPADNSLGEALPRRPIEPAIIEPIPVEPPTPVFEPPPAVARPEEPVPPPQMQDSEPPVSVSVVEPPPTVIPTPIPVAMPMPKIAVEPPTPAPDPPTAVINPVTTVAPPQVPEPVITIAPKPVPVVVAEPDPLPPQVIASPPLPPTPPPPTIIPAPPPEPIAPAISNAPVNAETTETTPGTEGNQVPDAVETPAEIKEISPETDSEKV